MVRVMHPPSVASCRPATESDRQLISMGNKKPNNGTKVNLVIRLSEQGHSCNREGGNYKSAGGEQEAGENGAQHSEASVSSLTQRGKKYATTIDTLKQREPDSMLAAIFSGQHTVSIDDKTGMIFIDRDGKHFRHILNWLRDGVIPMLQDSDYQELIREAEYYQLLGLVENINASLCNRKDEDTPVVELTELTRKEVIQIIQSEKVRFRGVNLSGLDLSKLDLSYVDFSYACIQKTNFSRANLNKAKFGDAEARGSIFEDANLRECELIGADLHQAKLDRANLQSANLQDACLTECSLYEADLRSAHLQSAKFTGANLQGANLEGANLKGAKMNRANLQGANLQRAYLREVDLRDSNAKLSGANLQGANLEGANLKGAKLNSANLQGANLQRAYLREVDLRGSQLEGAKIGGASLLGVIR